MNLGMRRLAIACVFAAWVIPRIIPLLFFPGTYSYDSWVHIGATEVIVTHNRIPFSGEYYSNLYMPFLHIFAYLIYVFFGLPLIETFRLYTAVLVFAGFTAFFAFFRNLLGNGWPSIVAMFIFSLDVDVAAQTNCAIPEHLALIFLALTLLAALSIVKNNGARREWFVILLVFIVSLPFIHHLTTYFAILFALALLVGSVLSQDSAINRIGIPLSVLLISAMFCLLLFVNPTASSQFNTYFVIILPILFLLAVVCTLLYFAKSWVWQLLRQLQNDWAKKLFLSLGILVGGGFFVATLLFYPYNRPLTWIAFKFGLLSCLFGFGVTIIRVLPWNSGQASFSRLFVSLSFLIIGASFGLMGLFTLIDAHLGLNSVWVFIGHRHFAFLLIPLSAMATLAIYKLVEVQRKSKRLPSRLALPTVTLLLLTFSIGGIYNLYQPIGGWYPEWMNHSEIGAGLWLRDVAEFQSFVVTDMRLMTMMQGMFPADTNRFQFYLLQESILSNPLLILENPRTHNCAVYLLTSDMMESYFLNEYPHQLYSLECSDLLDISNSTAKIYSRRLANVYRLLA